MSKTRIYGRFSSKPQERGDSKRQQVEGGREYAIKNGLGAIEAHDIYFDEAVSGKAGANLEKEFGRLLTDSNEGDNILVQFSDRIGRQNPFITGKLLYDITQKGVNVIIWGEGKTITKENINELGTQLSVFTGGAISFGENQRKITRVKETNDVTIRQAARGVPSKNIVKFLPTSYVWNDLTKKIDIDPFKAGIIQRIFKEYTNGIGKTTICKELNADEIPTVYTGKQGWLEVTIKKILKNEAYAGKTTIMGQKVSCFPAIVSRETFDKAQVLLERWKNRRGKVSGKVRINNLFAGIALCEKCGGTLQVNVTSQSKSRKTANYSLRCWNAKTGSCKTKRMCSYSNIETLLIGSWFNGAGESLLSKKDTDLKFKADAIKLAIGKLDTSIGNLYDMAENGDKEAQSRIKQRKQEKQDKEQQLNIIKLQMLESSSVPTMIDDIDKLLFGGKSNGDDMAAMMKQPDSKIEQARDDIKNFFPNLKRKLSDNAIRKQLAIMLPSVFKNIVVDLETGSYFVLRKDGTAYPKKHPKTEIQKIKEAGFNW